MLKRKVKKTKQSENKVEAELNWSKMEIILLTRSYSLEIPINIKIK